MLDFYINKIYYLNNFLKIIYLKHKFNNDKIYFKFMNIL